MTKMPNMNASLVVVFLIALIFMGAALAMLIFPIQPPLVSSDVSNKTPTKFITIYGGEINTTKYGFGLSRTSLSSPGPTLNFNMSDIVKLTFVNIGNYSHGFAITDAPKSSSTVLFGAAVGSGSNPLTPDQSGSVIFQPTATGSAFYYICPVPGHAELFGMWGHVTVASG